MIIPGMYFHTPYQPAVTMVTGIESKSTSPQYQPMYQPPTVNAKSADHCPHECSAVEDYRALSQTSKVQPFAASPTAGSIVDVFV